MEILLFNIILSFCEAVIILGIVKPVKFGRRLYCWIILLQCFVLHAFIDPDKMVDLPNYISTFNLFSENTLEQSIIIGYSGVKMEIGWILLCKILSLIYNNYIVLLIFTSMIIVSSYILSIYRYSPIIWLSVFLYLCSIFDQSLYVLRQHTAMAICLLSIPSVINRHLTTFLIILIFAILIHSSALIFFIIYPIFCIKFNKIFWLKFLFLTLIVSILSSYIFDWFFTNTWYDSYSDKEGSNFTGFFIALCTLLLFLYANNGDTISISKVEKCFLGMAVIAVFISFIGVGFSPTNRLDKYFTISSIFLIPISLKRIKDKSIKYIISIFVVIFYLLLFFSPSNINYIDNYRINFLN